MKLFGPVSAIIGALLTSQAPEFAQQYVQRLAGAEAELRAFIEEFDRDAARLGLSREEALAELTVAGPVGRGRAARFQERSERADRLARHLESLRAASDLSRPLVAMRVFDLTAARGVATDYRPAVPVTEAGAVYAAGGAVIFGLSGGGLAGALAGGRKRKRPLVKSRLR